MDNRFQKTDHGYLDTQTGLEWAKEVIGPMPWQEAMVHVASLGDGWRLPTIHELITLIDFSKHGPASSFPGQQSDWFWSSSRASSMPNAWHVNFYTGYVYYSVKVSNFCARCVRGEK